MTCIAWDGKELAADKASTVVGLSMTVTKIHKVYGRLIAFTGDADPAMQMLAWFKAGADPAKYPEDMKKDETTAYVIEAGGQILKYTKSAYPEKWEDRFFAAGSGRDYAMAAMYLGKSAREAVEVACHFENSCGNGVDTLTL